MKNCEYWIWLQRTLGCGARIDDIIGYYGSARELYHAGKNEWMISGIFTGSQIKNLSKYSPSESGKIINDCSRNNWDIITPDDPEYPPLLRHICDFPAVLYADGNTDLLSSELFIAMVGTRNASVYGTRAAAAIAKQLSQAGLTVVSGGALGVDSASHTGALNADCPTVCVLGCGLGTDYLMENEPLRHEICRKGVIITEFPPFTAASRYTFPKRNRIISGMSLGTVVIEAGERSGSLITARTATEQNRDVFAVPGNVFASSFNGANRLIHDGAKPVFTAMDIVEEYIYRYPDRLKTEGCDIPLSNALQQNSIAINSKASKPPKSETKGRTQIAEPEPEAVSLKPLPETASSTAKAVYEAIDSETDFDTIAERTELPVNAVLSGITELEMYSCIQTLAGRKYKKF